MQLSKQYFVNVVAQGLGRISTFGSNFLAFALIARICGAEFFGQYAYIIAFFGIFASMADFGMTPVLSKDIVQTQNSRQLYWGNFLILRVCLNFVIIIISIVTAFIVRKDLFIILSLGLLSLPFLASRFFEPIFQVFQRPWYSAYSSIFYGTCHLIFIAFAFLFGRSLSLFVMGYISANVVYTLAVLYLSRKSIKPLFHIDTSIMKRILKLAIPLGVSSLFVIISGRISVLMLASMKSDYAVGIYSAAYKFIELLAFFAAMVTAPLIPIFAEKAQQNLKSLRKISSDIAEVLAIFVLPVGVICTSISEKIIFVVYGSKLMPAADAFNILIWVGVIIFYSLFISNIVVSVGVVNFAYWTGAGAAILSITFNYLLIPKYSYIGSAWTALLCEVFLVGTTIYYTIRHIGNFFRWNAWVKILTINSALYLFLHSNIFNINIFIKIIISLVIYAFLVLALKIVRKEMLDILLKQKQLAFLDTGNIGRIINYIKYLMSYIYSEQVRLRFDIDVLCKYADYTWILPKDYLIISPAEDINLEEWANLLSSDGHFGEWSPEKIKSEIIHNMISPDSASLLYYKNNLIGCCCACVSKPIKPGIGYLMWVIIEPSHRGKGLSHALVFRTTAYFAKEKYSKVFLNTDTFRYKALHLYLQNGAKPVFSSLCSYVQWWQIKSKLKVMGTKLNLNTRL